MTPPKVEQFENVKNQFIIKTDEGEYFQSYNSVIAFVPNHPGGNPILDEKFWDYSKTTSKYRNKFLNMSSKEIKHALDVGAFVLGNLN